VAWTYDEDGGSDRDLFRLLTGDIDGSAPLWSDAEVAAFLALETRLGVRGAAALALERLATDKARMAVRLDRLGVSDDLTKVASEIRASAKVLRDQANEEAEGGVMIEFTTPGWTAWAQARNEYLDGATITSYAQRKAAP
jgi:hypothetical protein